MTTRVVCESKYLNGGVKYDHDKKTEVSSIENSINIELIGSSLIVIRHEDLNNTRYCVYNMKDIIRDGKPPGLFCHEVIYGDKYQKLRFDIDAPIDVSKCNTLDEVMAEGYSHQIKIINEMNEAIIDIWNKEYYACTGLLLSENDIMIMSSSGLDYAPKGIYKYKVSLHILVAPDMFVVENNREAGAFAVRVKEKLPEKYRLYFDDGIYNSKHNLRILGSFKTPQNVSQKYLRQKIILGNNPRFGFKESLVTYTEGLLPIQVKLSTAFVESTVSNLHINDSQLFSIKSLLSEEERSAFMIRSIARNTVNFDRISPTFCEFCKRTHDKDNTLFLTCDSKSNGKIAVTKRCRKNPGSKVIGFIEPEGKSKLLINTLNEVDNTELMNKFDIKGQIMSCIDDIQQERLKKKEDQKKLVVDINFNEDITADDLDKLFNNGITYVSSLSEDDKPKIKVVPKDIKFGSDMDSEEDLYDGLSDSVFDSDCMKELHLVFDNKQKEIKEEIYRNWSTLTQAERDNIEMSNIKSNYYVSNKDEDLFDKWPNHCKYSEAVMRPFVEKGDIVPRTVCVKAPMKMGKTKMLREFIIDHFSDPNCIIRILTFRRTFASHMHQRFADLGFSLYDDKVGKLSDKRLIIQMESLHRLELETADLVVMDESELLIEQINSGLFKQFVQAFAKLDHLIKYSKHLICMDAYMGDRTYRVLNTMRGFSGDNMLFHFNNYKRDLGDKYMFTEEVGDWMHYVTHSIDNGEKIAIMTNSLTECKTIKEHIKGSCNKNINIGVYSSETAKSIKYNAFNNVDAVWSKHDVLIITPTVSAGVSFEVEHFDRVFGYFIDTSCPVETSIQMLGRVRNVKTREYIILTDNINRNLPTNIKELRRRLQQQHLYLMSEIGNSRLDFVYDIDGNIEIRNTDYMQIWLENQRIINLSKNNYLDRFISIITKYGAEVSTLDIGLSKEDTKTIEKEHKNLKTVMIEKEAKEIADSENLTIEKYTNIKTTYNDTSIDGKEVTREELNAYKKFNFKQFYGLSDCDLFTCDEYIKFSKDDIKRHFINLNVINLIRECDIITLISAIKIRERQYLSVIDVNLEAHHKESLDIYESKPNNRNTLKDSIKDHTLINFRNNSIIHDISNRLVLMCGWNNVLDTSSVSSTTIMVGLKQYVDSIKSSATIISSILDKQWVFPDQSNSNYFNESIKFINILLSYAYGIKIVKNKKITRGVTEWVLALKSGFVYNTKFNKYLIPKTTYNGKSKDLIIITPIKTVINDIKLSNDISLCEPSIYKDLIVNEIKEVNNEEDKKDIKIKRVMSEQKCIFDIGVK